MKKILVVDDSITITTILKSNLEGTGKFQVRVENRGALGAVAARQFQPDLAILDVMMPDMGGPEVMSKIRESRELRDLPVIFLTATVMKGEGSGSESLDRGYLFLAKPVTKEELVGTIESLIGSV